MKVATIVGARPQFIKSAVLSRAFKSSAEVQEVIIHTGQHYDRNMSAIFFDELGIAPPAYNLGIGSYSHGAQTGRMLEEVERALLTEKPDLVVVFGDTNSTLAGALAASKLHILLAHVEAGLRSFERQMPEEINRIITDHISDALFAPTIASVQNLRQEGIPEFRVHLVGDVVYDAALYYAEKADLQSDILKRLQLENKEYILATIHRAENTDNSVRLNAILDGLTQLSAELPVIIPIHPRTRSILAKRGMFAKPSRHVHMIDPTGYLDMVMLERHARLIATDSGGVQKEAFFYQVPCVTLREETEWVELVELGWNRLAPPSTVETVVRALREMLNRKPSSSFNPYGDGHSAERIAEVLTRKLSCSNQQDVVMS